MQSSYHVDAALNCKRWCQWARATSLGDDNLRSLNFSRFVARTIWRKRSLSPRRFEIIACKEARFTIASSSTCTPTSTFYKLLEIERLRLSLLGGEGRNWL